MCRQGYIVTSKASTWPNFLGKVAYRQTMQIRKGALKLGQASLANIRLKSKCLCNIIGLITRVRQSTQSMCKYGQELTTHLSTSLTYKYYTRIQVSFSSRCKNYCSKKRFVAHLKWIELIKSALQPRLKSIIPNWQPNSIVWLPLRIEV